MLFTISREGVIYLNAPLDRETQDQVSTFCNLKLSPAQKYKNVSEDPRPLVRSNILKLFSLRINVVNY